MQKNFKTSQIILAILVISVSLLLFVSFGWSMYATITERPGLYGDMHFYYKLSRLQFSIYTGLVSITGLVFGTAVLLTMISQDKSKLTKLFKYYLIFFILFILCEIYLQTRFTGKV